jgi:hypothetical protein
MTTVDVSSLIDRQYETEMDRRKLGTSSALKTSNAACIPLLAPSHCSALMSLGRTNRWKVYSTSESPFSAES